MVYAMVSLNFCIEMKQELFFHVLWLISAGMNLLRVNFYFIVINEFGKIFTVFCFCVIRGEQVLVKIVTYPN